MAKVNNKAVRVITEKATDLVAFRASGCSDSWISERLNGFIECLAVIRGTSEDHEYMRVERLYKMRKKRGLI